MVTDREAAVPSAATSSWLAFVIAAVLTPPDVVSQLALAMPMCLLYEVGIIGRAATSSSTRKAPGTDSAAEAPRP